MGSSKTMKNIDRFGIWATTRVPDDVLASLESLEFHLRKNRLYYWVKIQTWNIGITNIHGDMIWIDMADHKASMPPKKRRDCNNQRQVGKRHSKTFVGRLMWLQIGCLMVSSCLVILFHRGSWTLTHSRWWDKFPKTRKGSSTHEITTFMGAINHP